MLTPDEWEAHWLKQRKAYEQLLFETRADWREQPVLLSEVKALVNRLEMRVTINTMRRSLERLVEIYENRR